MIHTYIGPFVAFPILFVGHVNDPVLPFSVCVLRNISEHVTFSAESVCTATALRDYMRDGKLPALGTVCHIESRFFDRPISANSTEREDAKIVNTWRALTSALRIQRFGP